MGSLLSAFGALAAGVPGLLIAWTGITPLEALRSMFALYGLIGLAVWILYSCLPKSHEDERKMPAPLSASRKVVTRLAILFSVDFFAGGLVVNALLALWLFQRFEMSLTLAGQFFFWSGLCSAASQLVAPRIAKRIGLLNTMVFTHIPASVCLIAAAFVPNIYAALALLIVRSLFSQMDVPACSAFVMAVVTPSERAAAASFTLAPKSLASAAAPGIGGALFAAGMFAAPLVACGVLKIAYDLAIWQAFKKYRLLD